MFCPDGKDQGQVPEEVALWREVGGVPVGIAARGRLNSGVESVVSIRLLGFA